MKPAAKPSPDIESAASQAALSRGAQELAQVFGGSAAILIVNQDGIAIQAKADDAVDIANMAFGLLLYAVQVTEAKAAVHDCPGCRSALARLTAARDILSNGPETASANPPTHRVH